MNNINIALNLIQILSNGNLYSKKYLGKLLNVTCHDINKYINVLYNWGIHFIISNNQYQLVRKINLIHYKTICNLIGQKNIIIKPIIDSTSQYLIRYINQLQRGHVCIAEHQTSGRGQYNRQWVSPFGCNIYLSLYWYFKKWSINTMGVSLVIGIVIAETLNKFTGHNIKIKWPNDLYLNKKKLAGILIDVIKTAKNSAHIIIGVGINIIMSEFYKTCINQEWINLDTKEFQTNRNIIISKIILALRYELIQFEKYGFIYFIKRWLLLDYFLNKQVIFYIGNRKQIGIVQGVNQYGAIIILKQNFKTVSYFSGVISLKSLI